MGLPVGLCSECGQEIGGRWSSRPSGFYCLNCRKMYCGISMDGDEKRKCSVNYRVIGRFSKKTLCPVCNVEMVDEIDRTKVFAR